MEDHFQAGIFAGLGHDIDGEVIRCKCDTPVYDINQSGLTIEIIMVDSYLLVFCKIIVMDGDLNALFGVGLPLTIVDLDIICGDDIDVLCRSGLVGRRLLDGIGSFCAPQHASPLS